MLQWQGVLFLPVYPRSEGAPLWWLNHFLGSANYFGQKLIWSSWLSRLAISFANMAGKCKCRSMNSSCRDVLPRCPLRPLTLGSSIIRLFVLCLHFVIVYIAEIIVISTRKSHLAHVTPFSGLNCFAWFFFFRSSTKIGRRRGRVTAAVIRNPAPFESFQTVATFAHAFVVNITRWQKYLPKLRASFPIVCYWTLCFLLFSFLFGFFWFNQSVDPCNCFFLTLRWSFINPIGRVFMQFFSA